jgi:hypothetical protein
MIKAAAEPLFAAARRSTYEGSQVDASFQLIIDLGEDAEATPEAFEQVQAIANSGRVLNGPSLPADGSLFWGGLEGSPVRLKPENVEAWLKRAVHFLVNLKRFGNRLQIEITGVGPTTMEEPSRGRPN